MPSPDNSHNLRLGYLPRANFAPLLYPLEAGWISPKSPWQLQLVPGSHSALIADLLKGELDAAFVSTADAQRWGQKLAPLGGVGLASTGAAETALLLAPRRIDLIDGEGVSIPPDAQGSTADHLFRTLISPYYGIKLDLHTEEEEGYNPSGSRIVFNSDATRQGETARAEGWVAEDIGLAWWILTGLPMVWEVLCHPRSLEERKPGAIAALQNTLKLSQRAAGEQASSILDTTARSLNVKPERVKDLFSRQSYALGPDEQKGLATYLDMAARARAF